MQHKPKKCRACPTVFVPTGNSQPFCEECQAFRQLVKHRQQSYKRTAKRGGRAGVGSGGANEMGCHDQKYRDWFLDDLYATQEGFCAHCGTWCEKDSNFLMHHKDHNRKHNVKCNLELMCKRCHQIEHECWLAFRKV